MDFFTRAKGEIENDRFKTRSRMITVFYVLCERNGGTLSQVAKKSYIHSGGLPTKNVTKTG